MKAGNPVIICGAGIAGVSAAYFLAQHGLTDVLLVDERPPLTLTSDRSTECYRNWWPDPLMLALMNRSIGLLEQLAAASANTFRMNRRGYLYVTADPRTAQSMGAEAERISQAGAGPLRIHDGEAIQYLPAQADGYLSAPEGADLLQGSRAVRRHFPYLSESVCCALHVRRAGWLSAQQLGMYLLEGAVDAGVQRRTGRIVGVDLRGGRVRGVELEGGQHLACDLFVNAAGPFCGRVAALLGLALPLVTEVHLKVAFDDRLGVVPRHAPLLIWNDSQLIGWQADELALLGSDPEAGWLRGAFPPGAHARPEGGADSSTLLMLWDYRTQAIEPVIPVPLDEMYPEIVLRGLATMLPGLAAYIGRASRPRLDGGYYTRTRENRPLIGPTPVQGAYVLGGLSGFGIMAACAAGELLALHVAGRALPPYADAFALQRYNDPAYVASIDQWSETGEL